MAKYSIIEYLGESNDGKCGYCHTTGRYNSYGFWAHNLNVNDYQALINRNWRRSGQYCYIPKNSDTCCPMYTIKCDALNFKLNKSHKKILKRMNKFLRDGIKDKERNPQHDRGSGEGQEPIPAKEHSDVKIDGINVSSIGLEKSSKVNLPSSPKKVKNCVEDKVRDIIKSNLLHQGEGDKPLNPKKAKIIRLERKKSKLAAKGLTLADIKPKKCKNIEKSLEDFLAEEPIDGKHRLEVKLVPSSDGSDETSFEIYKKYQMHVHHDPPEKLSSRSYERFLVTSPLQTKIVSVSDAEGSTCNINLSFHLFCKYEKAIHKSTENEFPEFVQFLVTSPLQFKKDDSTPPQGFGSFHYQYYLDGVLIAVGVIDILPECVSSVYFFYDPAYSFLSLGTYASLRELALVRELSKSCQQLTNYYLGFYIPSCFKMRYKANVKPSYLLCPEVYTWHLLDDKLTQEIDAVSYKRINMDGEDEDKVTDDDLRNVLVLANRTAMKYGDFKRLASLPRKLREDSDEVKEYATIVGRSLSQKMLLFRC